MSASLQSIGGYPLTSPQREIWFDQMFHGEAPLYNIGGYMRLERAMDHALFERAVRCLVRKFDVLRTVLCEAREGEEGEGGMPQQVFADTLSFDVPLLDFSDADDPAAAAMAWMRQRFAEPFVLQGAPLFRYALLKLDAQRYYVFACYHHLICDGWTIALLIRALGDIYTALEQGQPPQPDAPSYKDFIENDRGYIASSAFAAQRAYWVEKFQPMPEPLFSVRYRGDVDAAPSQCSALTIARVDYDRLAAFASDNGASTFHVILGALYVYFTRTVRRDELVIGLPVLNRSNAAFKATAGLFVGVTPARFRFGTQLNFTALLQAIGRELKQNYRHQRFPISELNRELGRLHAGQGQLFDIGVSYEKHDYAATFGSAHGMAIPLVNEHQTAPLMLYVREFHDDEPVQIDFVYNKSCFNADEIAAIQQRLLNLFDAVQRQPDVPLTALPVVTAAEYRMLTAGWNATAVDYPQARPVHELFEAQARATPEAPALVFEGQTLSYRELDAAANRLAHRLLAEGSSADGFVGLCVERSIEMVVGMLGVMKAGAAYVPLDPDYPVDRLATMMDDGDIRILLTRPAVWNRLGLGRGGLKVLDLDLRAAAAWPDHAPDITVDPRQLAYMIYTSGSTGKPKGVEVPHCGVANRLLWMQETYPFSAEDRLLQKTPYSFDVSVWEFFSPLIAGATLVMSPPGAHKDPAKLAELIQRERITVMHFVPSMLQVFVEHGALPQCTSLARVFTSGEALPAELQQRFFRQSQASLHNLYGPTEASIEVTAWDCRDEVAHTVPIGYPIANTQIYLLDESMEPVPAGVEGELYIGGVQVARGYHGRPDLTAERFVPDPFGAPGTRLYRTGDLARWRGDGAIEYLGRTDHQVKIRGLRIELGEIEAVLLTEPSVREAIVVAREDGTAGQGGKRLVAYLVMQPGAVHERTSELLRAHLLARLPEYMTPSAFVFMDALPLSPNGKADRKALPAPEVERGAYRAPATPTEIVLAQLWSDLLGCEQVGRDEHFFALGGHSLLAARQAARVRSLLGVELALRVVFEAPLLRDLAARIDALGSVDACAASAQSTSALPALAERGQPLPLSFPQQRLWFLDRMEPGGAFYNIPAALNLRGALDVGALQAALDALVQRHEILRTTYALAGDDGIQVIVPQANVPLAVTDLSALVPHERAAEAKRLSEAETGRGFDLGVAPVLRAHLLRLDAQENRLLLCLHHIAADGWSLAILQRELGALYNLHAGFEQVALPALPLQYADFAVWQRALPQGPEWTRQLDYWRDQLAGAPALLELPTDHPRPAAQSYRGATHSFSLPLELTRRLHALAQQNGASLFMTLLAAFGVLLARHSRQHDLCIGTPIAGRRHAEFEGLIGCFVNTLVLRLKLEHDPRFDNWLQQVRETALQAFAHQDIPFEHLVETLQPERDLSRSPLFQVMFALQNSETSTTRMDELEAEAIAIALPVAKFDLSLDMHEEAGALHGCFEYSTDLFERTTIARMAEQLQVLLEAIAAQPENRLSALPLLDGQARRQILREWNDSASAAPQENITQESIVQSFEDQAQRTPKAAALVHETRTLSYAELNREANHVAHALIAHGVRPDDLVGVCFERSPEMIVAVLGVLKAGAAYLPLDPAYPAERLALMLEDARPVLLLTQQHLRERVQGEALPVLCLDGIHVAADAAPSVNPGISLHPETLAYVLYTSGSTGRPKGVMVRHGGLRNLACFQANKLRSHGCRSILQFASLNFDMSVEEIFPALITGAQLVIRPADMAAPDAAFLALVEAQQIDALNLPTVFWHEWVNRLQAGSSALPACVKLVAVGGEKVHAEQYRQWTQWTRLREGSWINAYGPTEATVNAAIYEVPFSELCTRREIPLGRPLANTRIYILDANLEPVPVGVPGELHIAGEGLARGYLGRPDLTAEKFIPDPFGTKPGARMYKSGDLARWLDDGTIEYIGRIDNQVKIRGFRIELGEIETALAAHPHVREAVVTVREETGAGKRLLAWYTCALESALDAAALRAHLAASLPDYMLPAAYVKLEAMPLTPNGKLDRKALPAPGEQAWAAHAYEAPQGETEQALASIWCDLLKLERIGRNDNFFELGGHSLLAVSLLERMRRRGLHAEVRTLFTAPTLAGLAAAADARHAAVEAPPNRIPSCCTAITPDMLPLVTLTPDEIARVVTSVPGGAANVQDIYPLGPLQQGILFHHLMVSEGDAYLERVLFALDTRARLDGFLDALQEVMNRHDILRTAVLWEGLTEPLQVVQRAVTLPVEEVTLERDAEDAASRLCARFDPRRYRLDVRQAPLVRAAYAYDAAQDRWLLLLLSHHLAFDHTALDILLEEVWAHMQGQGAHLPAPQPFRNFIAHARLGTSAQAHEAFFKRMLADVDEPTTPFGLQDTRGDGSQIVDCRCELDSALASRIREQARAWNVSAATLFHVAWAQVLARTSGRSDVVFGTVLFGRMQAGAGAERAMGLFINTLPLRLRMDGCGIGAKVSEAHALLAELLSHEHASLAQAQRCSAIPAPAPLFSAVLNYRYSQQDAQAAQLASWEGLELLSSEERTNYPFALSVDDLGAGFALSAQTVQSIDPARICAFMQAALESLVHALEQAPGTPSHAIEILPPHEQALLRAWNNTEAGLPSDDTIVTLFEAAVARHPDQVALVFEDSILTYAQLNARANRLAHCLHAQDVDADELVALCLERSPEMIVAVLAVLKAGGAYLPLDPALPPARIAYMLEDAQPRLLLTQQHLSLPEHGVPTLHLERDPEQFAAWPEHDLPQRARPEHLAYAIYTSGSTGNPKGTLIQHRALLNLALAQRQALGLRAGLRVLQWASFNFDASVWDIFPTLCAGAQLCLASREAVLPGQNLFDTLRDQRIELITLTPSSLSALPTETLPDLKTLVVAGERCEHALIAPWLKRYTVINAYGPTEATVCATVYPCRDDGQRHPPIGRPIANTQVYILDAWMNPVPHGVAGELYIGGEGLARGYLGRPDLTAERFTQNPFSEQPGARMYRTGDLARYLPDGQIEYVGRADHQVKIRGFRIELGEIEFALDSMPGVREAVVLAQQAVDGPRLIACVVADAGIDAPSLRKALAQKLPEYMVPAHFIFLDKLPLNTSGKIDRKALEALEPAGVEMAVQDAPRTALEQRLAHLWAELLGRASIGRDENFFDAGGNSLLAVRLIARINADFGCKLPVSQMFVTPSVAGLAAVIDAREVQGGLVVPLRQGQSDVPPVWLMHPAGGTVFCYRKLAARLAHEGAVLAIQSPEVAGVPASSSFDLLARRYVDEIKRWQPAGPVQVAGWSMGGALALRVAELLEEGGREVAWVAMFDTMLARQDRPLSFEEFLAWAFSRVLGEALSSDGEIESAHACAARHVEEIGAEAFLQNIAAQPDYLTTDMGLDESYVALLREQHRIQQAHIALMEGCVPGEIEAPLFAFMAEDSVRDEPAAQTDWTRYSRDRQRSMQYVLPGRHENVILLDRNVETITGVLSFNIAL